MYSMLLLAYRSLISGLHGSAGDAIVLENGAALKTDSRYCDSIPIEMDCNWTTFCPGSVSDLAKFVGDQLENSEQKKIGADPFLFTQGGWQTYADALATYGVSLVEVNQNLVDNIWDERPDHSTEEYFIHEKVYTGATVEQKVQSIVEKMNQAGADYLIITRLDSIAWLLNLRGLDIPFSPVIISYLIVKSDGTAVLYPRDKSKIDSIPEVESHLNSGTVKVEVSGNYDRIHEEIAKLRGTVWVPATGTTYGVLASLDDNVSKLTSSCPVEYQKSIKNEVEQNGMRRSGLFDAVAISEALLNIEVKLTNGERVTELDVEADLIRLRGEVDPAHYRGESFGCIAASGPNAANNHYSPTEATNRELSLGEIFLLDNGGQYLDGTTDVTRTIFVGNPDAEIKGEVALNH